MIILPLKSFATDLMVRPESRARLHRLNPSPELHTMDSDSEPNFNGTDISGKRLQRRRPHPKCPYDPILPRRDPGRRRNGRCPVFLWTRACTARRTGGIDGTGFENDPACSSALEVGRPSARENQLLVSPITALQVSAQEVAHVMG